MDMKYTFKYFNNIQKLKSISIGCLKDIINVEIQQQQINKYANWEERLRKNLSKIYGLG